MAPWIWYPWQLPYAHVLYKLEWQRYADLRHLVSEQRLFFLNLARDQHVL